MRHALAIFLGAAALAGCGSLPVIRPVTVPEGALSVEEVCASRFPEGPFGVVHALEVELPRLKKKAL